MEQYKKFSFNSIGSNEKVLRVIHRSVFDIASQYIIILVVAALLFSGLFTYPTLFPDAASEDFRPFYFFIMSTAAFAVWIYCFLVWIDYYFDIWIITNEKIINIEQKSLFIRRVSEVKYEKIQDVTVEVFGMLQTVINFGDVTVQTAANTDNIIFRKVSAPYEIKNLIVKLQKEREHKKAHDVEEAIKDSLSAA